MAFYFLVAPMFTAIYILLGFDEFHRDAVHTIAQTGRLRAVVEDVAEMGVAAIA